MNEPDRERCERLYDDPVVGSEVPCGAPLKRLISRVPFVLKDGGSCGWSRDGYISSGEQPKQIDE